MSGEWQRVKKRKFHPSSPRPYPHTPRLALGWLLQEDSAPREMCITCQLPSLFTLIRNSALALLPHCFYRYDHYAAVYSAAYSALCEEMVQLRLPLECSARINLDRLTLLIPRSILTPQMFGSQSGTEHGTQPHDAARSQIANFLF